MNSCHIVKHLSITLRAKFDANLLEIFEVILKTFGLNFVDMV